MIFLKRAAILLSIWLVLTGADTGGLALGVATALGAAWISLRLAPPGEVRVGLVGLASLLPGFVLRSVKGGVDVARRALHPRLPIRPGWVIWKTKLPPGGARVGLGSEVSLLPGTLIAGSRGDNIYIHCLDLDQDVMKDMQVEEARLARILKLQGKRRHA